MNDDTSNPSVIQISLTRGFIATVSPIDADLLEFKWLSTSDKYAMRFVRTRPNQTKQKHIIMHRVILERMMGRTLSKDEIVDHINGDKLDNTRENLRLANKSQNNSNRGKSNNNTSGYKGVYWHKAGQKWGASIGVNNKNKHLGLFESIEKAVHAYNEAAIKYHGEFAQLNEIEEKR